jgi:hypothetical protein
VASCLFTALLEAGFMWGRRGYDLTGTLANNFNPTMLEIGIPAPWQVLAFGLLFAITAFAVGAATGREALRIKAASVQAHP